MVSSRLVRSSFLAFLFIAGFAAVNGVNAQTVDEIDQFGPVVRAYLGYLRNEQSVVDDRVSRREVNVAYYRRNSNRIRALRQIAMRIAQETQNDYLPELEAVAADELGHLFERPPRSGTLKIGEVLQAKFRYLGAVRSGEPFYIFARLDPYEQAELIEQLNGSSVNAANPSAAGPISRGPALTRVRRVNTP
ncbi:MAG: hypothetical protein ACR2HX_18985 [Pyrinomonadaceae bacterium]